MKKVFFLALAVLMVMNVFAGGSQEAAPAAAKVTKDTLVVAVPADPGDLSPAGVGTAANQRVLRNIYESVIAKEYGADYVGELAEKFGWADDNHYEIVLRPGITFSDGSKLDAETLLYCLKVDSTVAAYAKQWAQVDFDKSTANDLTVSLYFNKKQAFFEDSLAVAYIFSKEAYEKDPTSFVTNPIGTGPYVLTNYSTGDSLTLVANENYWGKAPVIKNVKIRVIADKSQRLIELESGGVDLVFDIAGDDIKTYEGDKRIETTITNNSNRMCLMMNNSENSVCQDVRVRQAIALAIDSVGITKNVYKNLGTASTGFLSTYYQYYDESLIGKVLYPYDVEAAKKLLAEAGYGDGLTLSCYTDDDKNRTKAIEIIQAQLKEIGITLKFEQFENTVRLNKIKDPVGWDITLSSVGKAETLNTISYYLTGNNACKYADAKFQALCEELNLCLDSKRCAEIVKELQAIFNEQLPMYPVTDNVIGVAYTSSLKNVQWWNRLYMRFDQFYFN